MLSSEINCCNPVLIVSPSLRQDALKSDCYFIDGVRHEISTSQFFDLLDTTLKPSKVLGLPFVHSLSEQFQKKHPLKEVQDSQDRLDRFLNDSFLLESVSGEIKPLWTYVPCGHCDACNHTKLVSYVQRCQFAMEETQRPAWFVTLTFNREHLPDYIYDFMEDREYSPEEYTKYRKRLLQLFKKRFKRNINKIWSYLNDGKECPHDYARDIKFIVTSEHGKLGRPHFHVIIFGVPFFTNFEPENDYIVRLLCRYCWRVPKRNNNGLFDTFEYFAQNYPKVLRTPEDYDALSYGFVSASQVSSSKVVNYVMKYSFKEQLDKDRQSKALPDFKLVSQNLGLQWLKARAEQLADSDGKFEYMSHFDTSVKKINLSGYYLKKLFPSSSVLSLDLRKSFYDICHFQELIKRSDLDASAKHAALCTRIYAQDRLPYIMLSDIIAHDDFRSYKPAYRDAVSDDVDKQYTHEFLLYGLANAFQSYLSAVDEFDVNEFLSRIAKRDQFFMKFKKRARSEILLSASRARRDIIINRSKSKLL